MSRSDTTRLVSFDRFLPDHAAVPVWCVTPDLDGCIHRFFDTSPFSPSGRYLAVFRLPFEDRLPSAGDVGEVVLVDLQEGTQRVVAQTRGWETQLGCNLNWGADDTALIFNDVDTTTWSPQVVRLNPHTGERQRWPGGVYQVSPDGRFAAAASLEKMRRTQKGYGVILPDEHVGQNIGAPEDDGLFLVDLQTGKRDLILSLADAVKVIPDLASLSTDELKQWGVYGFHCKWSPDGERLIFTVRRYLHHGLDRFDAFARRSQGEPVRFDVLTLKPDGSDVHNAVPARFWEKGGHHINFFPDGEHLSMNLGHFRNDKQHDLVRVRYDGKDMQKITDAVPGSGHPTVHPDGRHILTDCYTHEQWTRDGTTPLRWIDLKSGTEREVVRITSQPLVQPDTALRLDPHPAWDRTWRWVAFNAIVAGTRRVFIADFKELLDR